MGRIPDLPGRDSAEVLERTQDAWDDLAGARLLLTGATGFIGTLLLESIAYARERTRCDLRVVALVRDAKRLRDRLPWTSDAAWLEVVVGDVSSFTVPEGKIDLVVHSANTGSPRELAADANAVARTVTDGSLRVRDLAAAAGATRMLHMSSGSVYGAHYVPSPRITEDDPGVPGEGGHADRLALAKRETEAMLLDASSRSGPAVMLARGFALCGPWLPLDYSFAFGNFIGAALRGETIVVQGDGTPVRSFLYSTDLVVWLWTILLKGAPGRAYNVGSEHAVTIAELAGRIAHRTGVGVNIAKAQDPAARVHWFVPSISRVREELGLHETVGLDEAIDRTLRWWVEHPAQ